MTAPVAWARAHEHTHTARQLGPRFLPDAERAHFIPRQAEPCFGLASSNLQPPRLPLPGSPSEKHSCLPGPASVWSSSCRELGASRRLCNLAKRWWWWSAAACSAFRPWRSVGRYVGHRRFSRESLPPSHSPSTYLALRGFKIEARKAKAQRQREGRGGGRVRETEQKRRGRGHFRFLFAK